MRIATIVLTVVVATSPVMAQTAPSSAATAAPAKEERKICKRLEQTGSRMGGGKRVCHTAVEWQQMESPDSFSNNVNGAGNMRGSGQR